MHARLGPSSAEATGAFSGTSAPPPAKEPLVTQPWISTGPQAKAKKHRTRRSGQNARDARATARAQDVQGTQANLQLAQKAYDRNSEHISVTCRRTSVLEEEERTSIKFAPESAEEYLSQWTVEI